MALYDNKFRPTPLGLSEEERNKKAAKVPGSATVTTIANPSFGTQAGQFLRVGGAAAVNRGLGATESIANAVQYPSRLARGVERDVLAGFTGSPNPNEGRLGGAPVQFPRVSAAPAPAAPKPAVAAPATASPGVRFAGIDAAPDNFYRNAAGAQKKSPSQSMTLDQANAAEVNAQSARRPGTQVGAGASPAAGAAAPISKSVGKFGETVLSNTGSQYAPAAIASPTGTIGSVQSQNFGNAAVPQAQTSIARPGTASTFGMGVNDPRLNDQTPVISRPDAIADARYRGADQMAEQYNNSEDRAARKATDGALDTAIFMARGKPGSDAAIANLLETKARLNSGAEGLSQEAIQNRGQRANQFDIAGMEQSGQDRRAQIAAASENYRTDANVGIERAKIAMPEVRSDAEGNLFRVSGTDAAPINRPDGTQLRGQVAAQPQQQKGVVTPLDVYKGASDELNTLLSSQSALGGTPDPVVTQRIATLRQQIAALEPQAQAQPAAGERLVQNDAGEVMRYNAKTKQWEAVK